MLHNPDASPTLKNGILGSIRSVNRAGADAGRAWAIAPTKYVNRTKKGQRPFTFRERLRIKCKTASAVFAYSRRMGDAPTVVIRHMGTEGLLANLLHVIEVLDRVRPDASVYVDWKLDGSELGFRYGAVGSDVWPGLFRPIGIGPRPDAFRADFAVDYTLWGTGKHYLSGTALQNQRKAYHRTITKWIEISNQNVLSQTHQTHADFFEGSFCLGVHRRVGNAGVASLQRSGRVPSLNTLLGRCDNLLQSLGRMDARIFLATDDAEAANAFKEAFGSRLIVRNHVRRTTASMQEVHRGDWGTLSLADAEDVLVDTLLLSRCNFLVHASSSVSTMASFLNPNLTLIPAYEVGDN